MANSLLGPSEKKLIELALKEDLGTGDVTCRALFSPSKPSVKAVLLAKDPLVLAGLDVARAVFKKVNPRVSFKQLKKDGDRILDGTPLAEIRGPAASLLAAERVALNFLQHLCGIATLTHVFVQNVRGLPAKVLDTRKTLPGWRRLEKYAVKMGGGENHRMGLYDAYLIKDNHLALSGSLTEAVNKVRKANKKKLKLEVEVTSLQALEEALQVGIDWVLLDNMTLEDMHLAVLRRNAFSQSLGRISGRPFLEASGGINLDNVRAVAQTGVDFISVGALTHSAHAVDISLEMISE
ncbi:MAG: carboxylating nicotinate-nucleotide diphosphorylase [bacterium]